MRRQARRPAPEEELLLRIALCPEDEARTLRAEAEAIAVERLPDGAFAALPLVYRRLASMGCSGESVARMKGIYRSCWTRNHLLRGWLLEALDALAAIEIVPVLLGGMRLATAFYEELPLRPVRHVELVVDSGWEEALSALGSAESPPAGRVALMRSGDVVGAVTNRLPGRLQTGDDELEGRAIRVLDPLDELLVAVAPAGQSAAGVLQSLLDVHALVVALGPELDWSALVARAADHRLSYRLLDALSYLARTVGTVVPDDALDRLNGAASTRRERLLRRLEEREGGVLGGLPATLAEHLRTSEASSLPAVARGLPAYLRRAWDVDRPGGLAPVILRKGFSRLRGRRAPAGTR